MQTVHYSKGRLIGLGLALFGLLIVGVCLWGVSHGKVAFAGAILASTGLFGLFMMVRYFMGGCVVLEYDRKFVIFHGMLGAVRLPWEEVTGIEIEKQTYNWIATNRFLKIRGRFSPVGYASITERLLSRQHRPIERLLDQIVHHLEQQEVVPQQVARQQDYTGTLPDGRSAGGIGHGPAPQMRRGGFGRKGL